MMKNGTCISVLLGMIILVVISNRGNCQNGHSSFRLFGIRSYSGELMVRGFYRDQYQSNEKFSEHQSSLYYSGGIQASANTFILHPNFCILDLGAGYMPESSKYAYMVAPDFSEVRTIKRMNFNTSFLSQKKISFIFSGNYNDSYSRRDNMTDIRTINRYIGGSVTYNNKYIPVTLDFFKRKLDQKEVQSGRQLNIEEIHIEGRAEQSFSNYDRQKLVVTHKDNSTVNENSFATSNTVNDINFNSIVGLGRGKIFTFNTTVCNNNQHGIYDQNRFQAMEDLSVKLPMNLTFRTNYNFYNIAQPIGRTLQQISTTSLHHQLFKSLSSRLYFEHTAITQPAYKENNSKTGIDLNYTKKIPWGQLHLSYGYFRYWQNFSADSTALDIANEEYQLSDTRIVLLRRPYILESSVIVKDATGTIFYQTGLDYILIAQGHYTEIRRIPSGQIPNDGAVFVSYRARQPNSYRYAANNHVFSTNISLLKGKLDLYYRLALQDYSNLENTDFITLNYFTRNVAGFKVGFDFLNGGIEYEDYRSSILPFHLWRYFISAQKTFANKLAIVINGSLQDYTMLNEPEARLQRYADLTGKVEYTLVRQTKLNLDILYRKQQGEGIDLDLLTARLEFTSIIYRLYFTAGFELYRRLYVGEKINFKGTYIQISRKF